MYLNCHSCFSFRFGVMRVKELLQEAQARDIRCLALTDINNTSACLEFVRQAKKMDLKAVLGIDFRNGSKQQYVGLAQNQEGFRALNTFLSNHQHAKKAFPAEAPILPHVLFIYPYRNRPARKLQPGEYIGIRPEELNQLILNGPVENPVALTPVTFRHKRDHNVHRLLRCIDLNILLSKLPKSEEAPTHDTFLSNAEVQQAYRQSPSLLQASNDLFDLCEQIDFDPGTSKNKVAFETSEEADIAALRTACYQGLDYRYPNADAEVKQRLEKELHVIQQMQFTSYFLINWDIVRYAREKGYFYVGRGSGANSIAAYALRITDVDPIELDLYFERFINLYRKNPPDFDLDFSWKDRDDVIRYIFEKYGPEHTALLATYQTYQRKAIVRELGKVFGLPPKDINELLTLPKGHDASDDIGRLIQKYSRYIQGLPSHLSIHAGGILISEKPIHYYSATNLPPKGYPLVHFSMIEAEDLGLYKFDILSQRGLGHIRDALALIKENTGKEIDIHQIQQFKTDEKIKTHLRTGRTLGCFYVESPAMRMLLTKLEADTYTGLVAASSIIRPGVAKSGMMREYILRFRDPKRRQQANPIMQELMKDTFGIMVYQEDVIKVAHYFAGLSLAEADVLRRGMSGKYRSREEFLTVREQFFANCKAKGYPQATTEEVWHQIESFAHYSFSKGHSASYAVESYQSLYLKAHYPLEFMVGVINNFGGFYNTEIYVHEARMNGADIQAPCVNESRHLTLIKGRQVFLGFIHMSELEEHSITAIADARTSDGPFEDLEDFVHRVRISMVQIRILIRVGAFRFTGKTKKALLWEAHQLKGNQNQVQNTHELFRVKPNNFVLPTLEEGLHDDAFDELEILGFALSSPFTLIDNLPSNATSAKDLPQLQGQLVQIAGYLVNVKNTPASSGKTMHFGTFIDQHGYFVDTTHFPPVAAKFPFRGNGCYLISGKVVEEFGFYSVEVSHMEKLTYANKSEFAV